MLRIKKFERIQLIIYGRISDVQNRFKFMIKKLSYNQKLTIMIVNTVRQEYA